MSLTDGFNPRVAINKKSGDLVEMTHYLKTWPKYFQAVKAGDKAFELRINDRDFQVGHDLVLQEYDNESKTYTGDELQFKISYLLNLDDFIGELQDQYVIVGLK